MHINFESGFILLYHLQLQRHFQADTIPRIERMRQKEQGLERRLLRVGTVYFWGTVKLSKMNFISSVNYSSAFG